MIVNDTFTSQGLTLTFSGKNIMVHTAHMDIVPETHCQGGLHAPP